MGPPINRLVNIVILKMLQGLRLSLYVQCLLVILVELDLIKRKPMGATGGGGRRGRGPPPAFHTLAK